MSIGLQQIWAKTEPFQSILTHSFISGIVAQVIVHKMIVPGVRNKLLALLSCTPEKFTDWCWRREIATIFCREYLTNFCRKSRSQQNK